MLLPAANVVIANNVFVDKGPQNKVPFVIYASRGINTGEPWSVNGITFKNNATSQSVMIAGGNTTDINLITDTAKNITNAKHLAFADKIQNDYHLTAGSTDLIDKGNRNLYRIADDIDRNKRDNIPDIGAYELTKNNL